MKKVELSKLKVGDRVVMSHASLGEKRGRVSALNEKKQRLCVEVEHSNNEMTFDTAAGKQLKAGGVALGWAVVDVLKPPDPSSKNPRQKRAAAASAKR